MHGAGRAGALAGTGLECLPPEPERNVSQEARVEELEAKLAFAEDLLDSLNREVYRQQQELELLRLQVHNLAQQMQNLGGGDARRPEEEIPPHW